MKNWIKTQFAYFNIVILKNYNGYFKKEWTSGNWFDSYGSGFEILNPITNKVVYRKGTHTTNLDDSHCDWEDISIFFPKNLR